MERLTETKVVLVVRETRLEELRARFNSVSQARFYVERLGGDFADYETEDHAYRQAVAVASNIIARLGRLHVVQRRFLPNFIFGVDDVVVTVGQDGLVANTLKYLDGQPLIGINPEPQRYDGILLPFVCGDLEKILPEVLKGHRALRSVTMAKATLNNGQVLHAVNDLFIGPKSHGSARYLLHHAGRSERQSSSGVIISTGLGSSGWFSSLMTGARKIAAASKGKRKLENRGAMPEASSDRFAWDAAHLMFTVREPFPSQTSGTDLVLGRIERDHPLELESLMPERGVIFSDGLEADFLEFNSGTRVKVGLSEKVGRLVA